MWSKPEFDKIYTTCGILEEEGRETLRVAVVYVSERSERKDDKRFHFMLWKNSSFFLFCKKKKKKEKYKQTKTVVKIFKCFWIIPDARFIILWM